MMLNLREWLEVFLIINNCYETTKILKNKSVKNLKLCLFVFVKKTQKLKHLKPLFILAAFANLVHCWFTTTCNLQFTNSVQHCHSSWFTI